MRLTSLLNRRDRVTTRRSNRARCRPAIDALEERMVLSAAAAHAAALHPAAHIAPAVTPFNIVPLTVTSVTNQAGQLLANVALGNTTTQVPLNISLDPSSTAAVPILDLNLNAIHLNLLGLKVDTSNIRLEVTATPGPGNLLGNLLADVGNLLNNGTPLGGILTGAGGAGALTTGQLSSLTSDLTNLLNSALGQITSSSSVSSATAGHAHHRATPAATPVLNLSLGPVNLNLLGLGVKLDNGANGPVTVAISAQPGAGNLLGNLISGVAHLLDHPTGNHSAQLTRSLERIAGQIDRLSAA